MRRRTPSSPANPTPGSTVAEMGSLGRGLDILRNLGANGSAVTVADLAAQPENSRATAERLLHTLASEGFLHRIPDHGDEGAYEPGLAYLTLGTTLLSSFSELWQRQPVLQEIASSFGVELLVATCDGARMLVIEYASASPVQQPSLVGSVAPLEASAWGRCLIWMHSATDQATLTDGIRQQLGPRAPAALGPLYGAFQSLEQSGRCESDLGDGRVEIGMPVEAAADSPLLAIGCVAPRALFDDAGKSGLFWAQLASLAKLISQPAAR